MPPPRFTLLRIVGNVLMMGTGPALMETPTLWGWLRPGGVISHMSHVHPAVRMKRSTLFHSTSIIFVGVRETLLLVVGVQTFLGRVK